MQGNWSVQAKNFHRVWPVTDQLVHPMIGTYRWATQWPVHASNRAQSSLPGIDDDMPHGGFNEVDGADITHLDPVLPAELRPAQPWNMVASTLIRGDTRLPRPCRAHRCLKRDSARFWDPNCFAEDRWQLYWSTNARMLRCSWSVYTWQMAYNNRYYGKIAAHILINIWSEFILFVRCSYEY